MLPEERPKDVDIEDNQEQPFYACYIIFNTAKTPPGLWSRLLSRIMHSVPKVCYALDKTTPRNPDISMSMSMVSSTSKDTGISLSTDLMSPNDIGPNHTGEDTEGSPSFSPSLSPQDTEISRDIQTLIYDYPISKDQSEVSASYDIQQIHLDYWKVGMVYQDREVAFRIESLAASKKYPEKKDRVVIVASPGKMGMKIIGQLVDLVVLLVGEWYPGLAENSSSSLQQMVPCYHYLTQLMQMCWADNPQDRPSTDNIIKYLCLASVQSVMSVHPMKGKLAVQMSCAITPHQFAEANSRHHSSELWVCCDGKDGTEINMYSTNTMVKVNRSFIRDNQIQCICLCKDHVWVGSRTGIDYDVVDIFSVVTRDLVHNIRMRENSVYCITCSKTHVYLGTLEGYCFTFSIDIKQIQANAKPRYKYVSEHAVDGIVVTNNADNECVWVSHTRYIHSQPSTRRITLQRP